MTDIRSMNDQIDITSLAVHMKAIESVQEERGLIKQP
jgi:hypothetical protein